MKRVTKVLYAFIFVCATCAGLAWVCGCKKEHQHVWSEEFKVIEGTDIHAKVCDCGEYVDGHVAEWSGDDDDTCNHEGCGVTRELPSEKIITVTAAADFVVRGETLQLTASETDVVWSVPDGMVGVFISESGLLTVGADAEVGSVEVTASKDGFVSGVFTVAIDGSLAPPDGGLDVFVAGVYADGLFNILEIKSASAVCVNGTDYALGAVTDGTAALTAGDVSGTIKKIGSDGGYKYVVDICGALNSTFSPFEVYDLQTSDFVGVYLASDGIIENIGGTYYKYGRFIFFADGTAVIGRVEVEDGSGAIKQGASEVLFVAGTSASAVNNNILEIGDGWRIVGLAEDAGSVSVVHYAGGGESAVRGEYEKSDESVTAPANLPISAGERFTGEKLNAGCGAAGGYYLGSEGNPLYVISGNAADGYLVSSAPDGVIVNYIFKFYTVLGVKQIKVFRPDGVALVDTLISECVEADDREYISMTDGSVTLNFSSADGKWVKTAVASAGEYVVSAEAVNVLEDEGVTLTVDGTRYGYVYDGENWSVAEGGLVFICDLWAGAEVKMEIACPDAELCAELGGVAVRIETRDEYDRRKAFENTLPDFGEERSGAYYGASGGRVNEIVIGADGVTYNQTALEFIVNKNGNLYFRYGGGILAFGFGQDGTLSVNDGVSADGYTAYKEVVWQGFGEERQGSYSFLTDVTVDGEPANLCILFKVGAYSLEYDLTLSGEGQAENWQLILIGLDEGVYTFMNAYGKKIVFRFDGDEIEVSSDGIQQLAPAYTAAKDDKTADEPVYLSVGAENTITASGEYVLVCDKACTVVFTFDENDLTVGAGSSFIHSGGTLELDEGEQAELELTLSGGVTDAVLNISEYNGEAEEENVVEDYGELTLGNNVIYYDDRLERMTLYLTAGAGVETGTYILTFSNVADLTLVVNGKEKDVYDEITLAATDDYAEISFSFEDSSQPVKIKVEKIN